MKLKPLKRKIRHRWQQSQTGVSATVRRKSDPSHIYKKVIQDVRQTFEGYFNVTINVHELAASVIDRATRTVTLKAGLLRNAIHAECIQRRDLGFEVIPLPLDEDEELVRDDKAGL